MHPVLRLSILALSLLSMTGCVNSYNRIETGGTERTNSRLDDGRAVLVTTPKDGGFGGKIYKGSGAVAARSIDAAFSRSARLVDVYPGEYHSLADMKDALAKNDYGYVVIPTLTIWARPEKGMVKISNQVAVKLSVVDADTGEEVSSTFLEAKGPSPTSLYNIFSASNKGPDELLLNAADDYVDDLYGVFFSF